MIKLIRGGCYYMNGALVKENQAFLTAAQKETARKGTMSYRILKEHNRGDEENLKIKFDAIARTTSLMSASYRRRRRAG